MNTGLVISITIAVMIVSAMVAFYIFIVPILNSYKAMNKFSNKVLKNYKSEVLLVEWQSVSEGYFSHLEDLVKEKFIQSYIYMIERDYFKLIDDDNSHNSIDLWFEYINGKKNYAKEEIREDLFWTIYFQYSLITNEQFSVLINNWSERMKINIKSKDNCFDILDVLNTNCIYLYEIRKAINEFPLINNNKTRRDKLIEMINDAFVDSFVHNEQKILSAIETATVSSISIGVSVIELTNDEFLPLQMRAKIEKSISKEKVPARVRPKKV